MQAILIESYIAPGTPIKTREVPDPSAADGEAIVEIRAAGVNPSDLKNAQGALKHATTLPRIIGRDYAGTVVDGPAEWRGKEVWGSGGDLGITRDGTFAEQVRVPVTTLRLKPRNLTMEQAAVVGIPFITAYSGFVDLCHAQAGETVLVVGASGAVGSAVIQLANWLSVRTIGTARDGEDAANVRAQVVIDLEKENLPDAVKAATQGTGADLCFNAVGGALFEPALESLANGGRMVCITSVGSRRVEFDLLDFYHNRLSLFGLDTVQLSLDECADILEKLRPGFERGALQVNAPTAVPLSQSAQLFSNLGSGAPAKFALIP